MGLLGLFCVMGLCDSHADVEGCEHGEDESLDIGHKAFEQRDKDTEQHAHHRDGTADCRAKEVAQDKDDYDKAKNDDMAGRHVGKESNHKYDGLGEDTHQLDERHQGENLEPSRHAGRVEDVGPVMAITADIGYEEGYNCECGGNGQIAGDIGTCREERYQTKDIA